MPLDREREDAHAQDLGTKIAIANHPLHVMTVTFPIALSVGALGADIFWWLTADPFFVRLGLWVTGWGFFMGLIAALIGLTELLAGPGIRRRAEAWTHGAAGFMLVSILAANWGLRVIHGDAVILPWGAALSLGGLVFVGVAGWYGGKLVLEHGVGLDLVRDRAKREQAKELEEAAKE